MTNLREIKRALRDEYAWPGGYPLFMITSDGGALSIESARRNWREIAHAHLTNNRLCGWYVISVAINYEDNCLFCDHSGEKIECAYPLEYEETDE